VRALQVLLLPQALHEVQRQLQSDGVGDDSGGLLPRLPGHPDASSDKVSVQVRLRLRVSPAAAGDQIDPLLETIKVRIKRLPSSEGLALPRKASAGSSGFDLLACVGADLEVAPGDFALVPTGLCVEIPRGYEAQVRPRSGLALRNGVTVLNTPGTIDSDYRGEVGVILVNLSKAPFRIRRGDRIAQIVFTPVCHADLEEAQDLERSDRGGGGFGHTGV
jgi:dUTP pyrophosphatase